MPLSPLTHFPRALGLFGCLVWAGLVARAAYAPAPAIDTGKDFTLSLSAGLTHDSNVFGSAENRIQTIVYRLAPKADYAASVTDQTFVAASYQLKGWMLSDVYEFVDAHPDLSCSIHVDDVAIDLAADTPALAAAQL